MTRLRAAIVVVVAYSATALIAKYFLAELQRMQGISDAPRVELMTTVFASAMLVLACWSLFNIFRRPKLVDE